MTTKRSLVGGFIALGLSLVISNSVMASEIINSVDNSEIISINTLDDDKWIDFTLDGDLTLNIYDEYILDYEFYNSNPPDSVEWGSRNSNILSISDGVVTAKGLGDVQISMTGVWMNEDGNDTRKTVTKMVHIVKSTMKLNIKEKTIGKESIELIATSSAKKAEIKWETSDANIATVQNGVVTGVGRGSCIITASTEDGAFDTCKINVNPLTERITLTSPITTLTSVGQRTTINVYQEPSDIYNKKLTWKSSNPSIAKVDQNGIVTAMNTIYDSRVTITAIATDNSGIEGTIDIEVAIPVSELRPTITKNTVSIGDTTQYKAVAFPFNVSSGTTASEITWSSDNTSIIDIDSTTGVSRAKEPGMAHVICTSKGVERSIEVCVRPRTPSKLSIKRLTTSSISFKTAVSDVVSQYVVQYSTDRNFNNYKSVNVSADETRTTTLKNLSECKYYFRVKSVLKNQSNMIESLWSNTSESDCYIKAKNISVAAGQKNKIKAYIELSKQKLESGNKKSKITFTSKNKKVATVNKYTGEVKGVKKGSCIIVVKYGKFTKDVKVDVKPSYNLKTNKSKVSIKAGKGYTLKATVTNYNKKSGKKSSGISYSSSNKEIASINKYTGAIKAKSVGICYIDVKYKSVVKRVKVTVS